MNIAGTGGTLLSCKHAEYPMILSRMFSMATLSYKSAHLVYLHASIYYVVERFLAELIQLKTDRL